LTFIVLKLIRASAWCTTAFGGPVFANRTILTRFSTTFVAGCFAQYALNALFQIVLVVTLPTAWARLATRTNTILTRTTRNTACTAGAIGKFANRALFTGNLLGYGHECILWAIYAITVCRTGLIFSWNAI
jgi:hypothetical protein